MAQGTFGEALDRYAREWSPAKRGARREMIRIEKLRGEKIAAVKVGDLRASDFADWRDRRGLEIAPKSVIREMQIMPVSVEEWGIIAANPLSDVRRRRKPPACDRLPTKDDMDRLALCAGGDLTHATARAWHGSRFVPETVMRAGEIYGLTWARVVPLSSEAVGLIQSLPKAAPIFDLTSSQFDVLWRKVRDRAAAVGLTFHDSRRWSKNPEARHPCNRSRLSAWVQTGGPLRITRVADDLRRLVSRPVCAVTPCGLADTAPMPRRR